jgi:hypothetical protein
MVVAAAVVCTLLVVGVYCFLSRRKSDEVVLNPEGSPQNVMHRDNLGFALPDPAVSRSPPPPQPNFSMSDSVMFDDRESGRQRTGTVATTSF